jgi:hypothetical protein
MIVMSQDIDLIDIFLVPQRGFELARKPLMWQRLISDPFDSTLAGTHTTTSSNPQESSPKLKTRMTGFVEKNLHKP